MFDFLKPGKKQTVYDTLPFGTDMHSHILPGIDDGAPDIETSLQLVKGIYDLGIRETVATPHVICDLYRNTPETINNALGQLTTAVAEAGIDIKITAAAEYMLDDYFVQLLKGPAPLLTICKKVILTEQPFASPSPNIHRIAFEIITSGYRPIMAHPERYHFYHGDYEGYNNLKDIGFLLQVNLLSLTGYYGKPVAKAARYLIENNLADLVGTDMHHARHLDMMKDKKNLQTLNELLSKKKWNNLAEL
jgi:tyrosine-protein phosphatase YwqE